MSDLYRENILDHYRFPRNFGTLENADASAEDANPLCGDRLRFDVRRDVRGVITDIAFSGTGCALSVASASLASEYMKGKNVLAISGLDRAKLLELLGANVGPGRIKCALLPLAVLRKILRGIEEVEEGREVAVRKAREAVRAKVIDPEVGINVVDMGLIYGIRPDATGLLVTMTLTSMTCPEGPRIVEAVRDAAAEGSGKPVRVELVWEPAWSRDMLSEAAKDELELTF